MNVDELTEALRAGESAPEGVLGEDWELARKLLDGEPVDPGSLPAASSTSTASGFAAQLASAQAAQPYAVSSGTLSPFTPCALPTSLGVSGVARGTGLAGAAKMLAAAKAALGGATTRPTTTPCRTGLLRHDLEQPGPGNAGTSGSVFWANISSRGAAVASIKWTRAKSTRS